MLMNRIVCLLSTTLLFTFPVESNISPFRPTEQSVEKQIDLNGMVHKNNLGFIKHPIQVQYEKKKLENEKKAEEERLRKEKELEEQKKNEIEWQEFVLTYYTSLNSENGFGAITCTGAKLQEGMVASNYYKLGTKIKLKNGQEFIVSDRGGNNFNSDTRLDVYVSKNYGESNNDYKKRVIKMGKKTVKAYIVK